MESSDLSNRGFRRTARVCGLIVAVIGTLALAGWAGEQPVLMGLRRSYIPMAPNTALAFIVLGMGLSGAVASRRPAHVAAGLGAGLIALISVLRLAEYTTHVDLAVDRWFFHVRRGWFGLAPLGRMSLPTAVAFVASGIALVRLAVRGRSTAAVDLTGACGLVAGVTGLVFSLGYLFSPNAPLFYGTESIPMALNTAFSFVALGTGLVAAAGPGAFPLRILSGPSMQARLLRVFLPLVVGTVCTVAWLTHIVTAAAGASSAAVSSAALAIAGILLFGLICARISGRVGQQLEQAETELQRANDELEAKVGRRTADLIRANSDLSRALLEVQAAHNSLQEAHHDLKQAQSRMLQQAKMASLGQTAAGVAHEINNPLAFVTNNLFVLRREVTGMHDMLCLYRQAEHTLAEYQHDLHARIADLAEQVDLPFVLDNLESLLERSQAGLKRIQRIVESLRDFSHLDEADFKEADLNAGILSTVELMRTLAKQREVESETDLAPIPRLCCSPAKINLVVQSLLSNAIDACPPRGRVVVGTRVSGGGVDIEVSDTGCGIDPAIRDKVFDPFFTTKPIGKGTGLGLSMSYGIIKDHGGTIEFDSSPGEGTLFKVHLSTGSAPGPLSPSNGTGGTGGHGAPG